MRLDLHVHLAADAPFGELSPRFRRSMAFRLLRRSAAPGTAPAAAYRERLLAAARDSRRLDGVVVLALDRPYSEAGLPLPADLYVSNADAAGFCRIGPKLRLGASVHPYRPDALEALDEAAALGAVLIKWLGNAQGIDPASPLCRPFYARLRELGLPLLSHTGHEHVLPAARHGLWQGLGDVRRLEPALASGVTVIAAHAGAGGSARTADILALAERHPRLFLDCSALCTPSRFWQMRALLRHPALRERWVYGSDYPVPVFWPLLWRSGAGRARAETNPLDQRAAAAALLGLPDEAFRRGANLCRLE
jgi:predicted TIM-barrel fold metal-dependent hydrolase